MNKAAKTTVALNSEPCWVYSTGEARAFELHYHDTFSIGLVLAGSCEFECKSERYVARKGELFVIPAFVPHRAITRGADFAYFACFPKPSHLSATFATDGLVPIFAQAVIRDKEVGEELRSSFERLGTESVSALPVISKLVARHAIGRARLTVPWEQSALTAAVATEIWVDEGDGSRKIAIAADRLGRHRSVVSRAFRKLTGLSLRNWRRATQLATAQREIADGVGLAEASASAGFADQSHMGRVFQSTIGMTPGAFAELNRHRAQR